MGSNFIYSFYTSPELYKLLVDRHKINSGCFKRNIKMDLYLIDEKYYYYFYKIDASEYFNNYKLMACSMIIPIIVKDNKLYVRYSNAAFRKILKEVQKLELIH